MSKSKILLEKLTGLLAQGLISYKDLSNEIINIIKSQRDEIILKMKYGKTQILFQLLF